MRNELPCTYAGTKLSTVQNPAKYLNICSPSSLADFNIVPLFARQAICTLYSGLQDLQMKQNEGAYTFVSQLVRIGPLLVTILSYESFRARTFWRRRGASFYLILAQVLSGAVSVPLYFANLCFGEVEETEGSKGKKKASLIVEKKKKGISGEEAWSVFGSVTFGYLAPLAYGIYTHWSNRAITTFLCFPVYIMTINTLLPPILRGLTDGNPSVTPPLLMVTGLSTLPSLDGHIKLLFSGIPFNQIFWPSHTSRGMTQDLHFLLLHDYTFVLVELVSYLFLNTYRSSTKREKVKAARLGLITSIIAGPVAALSLFWARKQLNVEDGSKNDDIPSQHDERTTLLRDGGNSD